MNTSFAAFLLRIYRTHDCRRNIFYPSVSVHAKGYAGANYLFGFFSILTDLSGVCLPAGICIIQRTKKGRIIMLDISNKRECFLTTH